MFFEKVYMFLKKYICFLKKYLFFEKAYFFRKAPSRTPYQGGSQAEICLFPNQFSCYKFHLDGAKSSRVQFFITGKKLEVPGIIDLNDIIFP